jgi:hypothetical protein
MANRDSFSAEEWRLLRLAPAMVGSGVGAADPSGLFGALKEAASGAMGLASALRANAGLELFAALAADRSMPDMPDKKALVGEGSREQQIEHLKTTVLEQVRQAVALVAAKASPTEVDAYRKLLGDVAETAANASTEGGFLGFGGVRVSDKEKAYIAEVRRAAGLG